MNCTKCGKEIPEGDKKICEDCQKKLLLELEEEAKIENNVEEKVETNNEEKIENVEEIKTEDIEEKVNTTQEKSVEKEDLQNNSSKKENKNKNKKVLAIILVIIALVIGGFFIILNLGLKDGISTIKFINNNVGNTIANIRNYGYTAEQGGMIYFVAPSEDGEKIAIYKTNKSKIEPKELIKDDWDVLGLNVVKDYIYFIAISDDEIEQSTTLSVEEENLDTLNNKIYRMKTDGTELEVINSNEFHNNCYEIYVIKNKIYYIGVDTNIWYMNLDGSEKTKLNDDKTGFLGLTGDYIILNIEKKQENQEDATQVTSPGFETCIMNIDGTDRKSLTGERLYSINVVGDYIYYVDANKAIYKVKLDGSDNVKISDQVQAYNMNIINNKIFYMNYVDNTQKIAIYSMNLDGTDVKEINQLENYSSFLNTINNKVIFMDSNQNAASINMINLDGSEKVALYELKFNIETNEEHNHESEPESNTTETQNVENNIENTNTEVAQ